MYQDRGSQLCHDRGRIAGIAAAHYLGYMDEEELKTKVKEQEDALDGLRQGMFAPKNRGKLIEKTEEGIDISMNLLKKDMLQMMKSNASRA